MEALKIVLVVLAFAVFYWLGQWEAQALRAGHWRAPWVGVALLLLLTLLYAASGCGYPEYPARLLVEDEALVGPVSAAAGAWNLELGPVFVWSRGGRVRDACRDVPVREVAGPLADDAIASNRWAAAGCHRELRARPGRLDEWLARHELGHLLDVPHSADPRSCMHPEVFDDCQLLEADLEAARRTLYNAALRRAWR